MHFAHSKKNIQKKRWLFFCFATLCSSRVQKKKFQKKNDTNPPFFYPQSTLHKQKHKKPKKQKKSKIQKPNTHTHTQRKIK